MFRSVVWLHSINSLYFPIDIIWSISWLMVMIEYGRAAIFTWRTNGGTWYQIPSNCFHVISWYLISLFRDLAYLFVRTGFGMLRWIAPLVSDRWKLDVEAERKHSMQRINMPPIVDPAQSGRFLRLFVAMSSFNMTISGLTVSMQNRYDRPPLYHLIIMVGTIISIWAAQGHLALAWTRHQIRWRLFVLACLIFIPVGFYWRMSTTQQPVIINNIVLSSKQYQGVMR